jgi:heme-degrading monooxygenase HmoA
MHARSGSFEVAPERLDDAIARFEQELIPRYREQSGYKGFSLLVDRESGKVHGLSFWDSEADLQATDDLGEEAREAFREWSGAEGGIVRKVWEVPIDDLP